MYVAQEHKKIALLIFLGLFLTLVCTSWYIQVKQEKFVLFTQLKIAEQETKLATIADMTAKDGADAVVSEIIKDCSLENRIAFDTQLSKLPELRGTELIEMEKLFNACGNFYAERKAVMVARLNREFEMYADLIDILSTADKKAKHIAYNTENWKRLVDLESKRSLLSTQLVDVQGRIIRGLKQQMTISSDEMQAMLVEGQKTKDELVSLSFQIDTVRQAILGL